MNKSLIFVYEFRSGFVILKSDKLTDPIILLISFNIMPSILWKQYVF